MRTGLFGKLPAKRDFIAVGAPREFLGVWEAWILGGISASRQQLGESWQAAFLRAPIWRFWLGGDICGAPVLGAFMPSVDGVGRYFPLTIFARAEEGEALAPPELDRHEAWLAAAEDLLLSALGEDASYEALTAALGRFEGPPSRPSEASGLTWARGGALVTHAAPDEATLSAIRHADHARVYAAMSYWWTLGGEGFEPCLIAQRKLPDPYLFAPMLTGRFDERLG